MSTFQEFVATRGTSRARRICRKIARGETSAPKVLLLYGPVSSGKSHLARATARERASWDSEARVVVISTESLRAKLVDAIRQDRIESFRQDLAGISFLVLEDVQVLTGKPGTQACLARELAREFRGHVIVTVAGLPSVVADFCRNAGNVRCIAVTPPTAREMRRIVQVIARNRSVDAMPRLVARIARRAGGDIRRATGEINRWEFSRRMRQ